MKDANRRILFRSLDWSQTQQTWPHILLNCDPGQSDTAEHWTLSTGPGVLRTSMTMRTEHWTLSTGPGDLRTSMSTEHWTLSTGPGDLRTSMSTMALTPNSRRTLYDVELK